MTTPTSTPKPDVRWSDAPVWKSIDCGPGWWPIIATLDQVLRERYPDYRVVQIKEKFGGLRFYADGVDAAGYEIIGAAERSAAETCEECGQPGAPRTHRYWYRTLCDTDFASWVARREEMFDE
jgi:hypothetical protein